MLAGLGGGSARWRCLTVACGRNWARPCPQAGGSYVFLREAYGANRFGRLMSFLFIWQTLFQAPLSISSGALGFADYSKYLLGKIPALSQWLGVHLSGVNYNRFVALGPDPIVVFCCIGA